MSSSQQRNAGLGRSSQHQRHSTATKTAPLTIHPHETILVRPSLSVTTSAVKMYNNNNTNMQKRTTNEGLDQWQQKRENQIEQMMREKMNVANSKKVQRHFNVNEFGGPAPQPDFSNSTRRLGPGTSHQKQLEISIGTETEISVTSNYDSSGRSDHFLTASPNAQTTEKEVSAQKNSIPNPAASPTSITISTITIDSTNNNRNNNNNKNNSSGKNTHQQQRSKPSISSLENKGVILTKTKNGVYQKNRRVMTSSSTGSPTVRVIGNGKNTKPSAGLSKMSVGSNRSNSNNRRGERSPKSSMTSSNHNKVNQRTMYHVNEDGTPSLTTTPTSSSNSTLEQVFTDSLSLNSHPGTVIPALLPNNDYNNSNNRSVAQMQKEQRTLTRFGKARQVFNVNEHGIPKIDKPPMNGRGMKRVNAKLIHQISAPPNVPTRSTFPEIVVTNHSADETLSPSDSLNSSSSSEQQSFRKTGGGGQGLNSSLPKLIIQTRRDSSQSFLSAPLILQQTDIEVESRAKYIDFDDERTSVVPTSSFGEPDEQDLNASTFKFPSLLQGRPPNLMPLEDTEVGHHRPNSS